MPTLRRSDGSLLRRSPRSLSLPQLTSGRARTCFTAAGYHELNPVLGEYPSRLDLAAFGTLGVALTYALTEILGDRYPMLSRTVVNSVVKSEQINIEWNQMTLNGQQRSAQFIPVLITWEW